MKDKLNYFSTFEKALWLVSVLGILISQLLLSEIDYLCLFATLLGVSTLMFVAKGHVAGQITTVVFSLLYAWISFECRYFGEMITYLGMTMPMAIVGAVSWLRNPHKKGVAEVAVASLSKRKVISMLVCTAVVTAVFYFVLKALGTASLAVSTLSVATSFSAMYMTYLRSPYYAVCYGLNDIVLIVLWSIAGVANPEYFTMVVCFGLFLANDVYGFINWQRMKKRQESEKISQK